MDEIDFSVVVAWMMVEAGNYLVLWIPHGAVDLVEI